MQWKKIMRKSRSLISLRFLLLSGLTGVRCREDCFSMVNHWGTILTREPIKLPPDGYLDIDPEKDWNYAGGDCRTVKEFMQKYPPVKKKDYER